MEVESSEVGEEQQDLRRSLLDEAWKECQLEYKERGPRIHGEGKCERRHCWEKVL